MDGPSAGLAMLAAVYSAYTGLAVDGQCAMTGEISLTGAVLPVGGVAAKVRAARENGFTRILIPGGNGGQGYGEDVVAVEDAAQALSLMLGQETLPMPRILAEKPLSAQSAQ